MKISLYLFLILKVIFVVPAFGFVPPLTAVLKANFEGRKVTPTETVFRHQIQLKNGESMALEERVADLGNKVHVLFRSPSYGEVAGVWTKGTYVFGADKKIISRSKALLSFYTVSNADQFREVLIEERLLKRDQFTQYKTTFTPQGDPASWDLKENYIVQPQVYFSRTPQGPAIMAVGSEEGKSRRAVFFDKSHLLLSRLEWREGNQEISWNFVGSKKMAGDGSFPEEMSLIVDNRVVVNSNLMSRQFLKGKSKNQWFDKVSGTSKSAMAPNFEEGLKILLGYR